WSAIGVVAFRLASRIAILTRERSIATIVLILSGLLIACWCSVREYFEFGFWVGSQYKDYPYNAAGVDWENAVSISIALVTTAMLLVVSRAMFLRKRTVERQRRTPPDVIGGGRSTLWILWATVVFVLAACCLGWVLPRRPTL